jgi:hypothetical protein
VKRTTGIAVLVTAAILIVAGNAPRLPWEHAVALMRQRVIDTTAWPVRTRRDRGAAVPVAQAQPHAAIVPEHAGLASPLLPPLHLPAVPRVAFPSVAPGFALALTSGAAAGIALALLLLTLMNTMQARRGERRHAQRLAQIVRLAQAGQAPGRIARAARVPRDAVRTLLAPERSQPR